MEFSASSGAGSSEVAAQLRDEIAAGTLKPNDRLLPQRDLSKKFDCSRGTVQRALKQLSNEGLLQSVKGSGTYVLGEIDFKARSYVEPTRPLELMDARFAFEPHVCRLAVMNAMKADFDNLEDLLGEMESSAANADRFAEFDDLFHLRLAEATGNSLLIWISEQLKAVRAQCDWLRMRQITLNQQIIDRYNQQHRSIVDAIRDREPEAAARCMREHLETARLSLTRASAT